MINTEASDKPVNMHDLLIDRIYASYCGVVLDSGVSLHETVVMDKYGQNAKYLPQRLEARQKDEVNDWTKLVGQEDFPHWVSFALTGLDALGLRYYLPPSMVTILRHQIACESQIFRPFILNMS